MIPTTRIRKIIWLVVGAAITSSLTADPAIAAADPDNSKPPTLQSLRLDAPTAYVTFTDNNDDEDGYHITLRERDNPDRVAVDTNSPGAVPGVGRVSTRSVTGVKPGVAYCATVQALIPARAAVWAPQVSVLTYPSNSVCADPTAAHTDLALASIEGEEQPPANTLRNYWVHFTNNGTALNGTAVIEVLTSGPLEVRRLPDANTFNGFTCTAVPASGGSTGGFRCTGGSLKQGEHGQIPLLAKVTRTGPGAVYASIGVSGGAADTNPSDNMLSFPVQSR